MRVISVNAGLPREVEWQGKTVRTAIFKEPVRGRVALRRLNFDGDRQADLTVHGGPDKAVYVYPAEHYAFWREKLPDMELPWGMFGDADRVIPVSDVRLFDETLDIAGVEREIVLYPGAPHGFFELGLEDYAAASADAWQRILHFIDAHTSRAGEKH